MEMDELRNFVQIPHIRCISCGRVTGSKQNIYDAILKDKEVVYKKAYDENHAIFLRNGYSEEQAKYLADHQGRMAADYTFNQRVGNELNFKKICCLRTMMTPFLAPLGSGVDLDPEVDIGQRMSEIQIIDKEEVEEEPQVTEEGAVILKRPKGRSYRAI